MKENIIKMVVAVMALVALAGPLSNLIVAIGAALIFNVLYLVLPNGGFWMPLVYFFYYFITINISLAVFNLLPVPPLDGSKIFGAVLPDRWTYTIARYERYIFLILAGALFSGVLDGVLGTLNGWAYDAIFAIADLPFRLFGLF